MASSFFYSNNCSRSVLAKNWRLFTLLSASACKICFRVALSSIVPAHFPNQISKSRELNIQKHDGGCGLANTLKKILWCNAGFLHTPCLLVSCLVPEWPPIAYKLYLSGLQSHANCTAWPPVACKFRPILFMLHATGGHASTICMRLAATRVQFICDWPSVACKLCVRLRPVACKAASFLQVRCENYYLN